MAQQTTRKLILALICLTLTPAAAYSAASGRPHKPPQEAINACQDKAAGDSVEFIGRRGETLKAICQEIEGQLVAVPEGMKAGGPPPKQ